MLHGLEKFHHYCFVREVGIITDHKPLVAIFNRDVPMLSENTMNSSQNTPIQSQNHIQTWTRPVHCILALQAKPQEKKYAEIPGMQLNIDVIQTMMNIPYSMTVQQLQQATSQDDHLQYLKCYIIRAGQRYKTRYHKTCKHN